MILKTIFSNTKFSISYVLIIKIMILRIIFSGTEFSNINFYVNSINAAIVIIKSLMKLDFYNFTFLIIRGALIKIIKKALFYLYS